MNPSKIILLFFFSALLFLSCKKEENLKEIEERKIKEQLDNIKVDFYKTIKVTVRSTGALPDDPKFAEARNNMLKLAGSFFRYSISNDGTITQDTGSVSVTEMLSMAKTFYTAKDVLLKTEEDSLPTILENILMILGTKKDALSSITYFSNYDANYEHSILGAVWVVTPSAPKEFSLYEFYRTDEDRIKDREMIMVLKLAKALMFLEGDFYYHSKEKSDEYLQVVEDNKEYLIKNPFINLFEEALNAGPEAQYYQLHSIGYLMRALAEEKMDLDEESQDDMELFVEEAEKGGGDNELIWLAGAYVSMKKENKDKALVYLNKLEKSSKIGDPEKKAVADSKSYLENRDEKKALTKLKDKLAMITITYDLIKARLPETKPIKKFKATKEGDQFFAFQKSIQDKSELINSLGTVSNADSLASKAKNLVKDFFGK